ncbi:MAG TPA: helix-turn-helix transcriptional regulator [Cyclobacteriaceae bacterium]|jgi:transcriptional regulator with XRE-family HTH domain|nr:helix-turn-helix transcriptional regulator [Cyclobacteriaceae bacterium]
MNNTVNFKEKLTKLREINLIDGKAMTQKKLAELLNVPESTVKYNESSKGMPKLDFIVAICRKFNISLRYFTDNDVSYQDAHALERNERLTHVLASFPAETQYVMGQLILSHSFHLNLISKQKKYEVYYDENAPIYILSQKA